MISYSKNTENYFDCDDQDRQLWYLANKSSCPFGDHCKAWDKYKHHAWSAIDRESVGRYCKQHAMCSSNHHLSKSDSPHYLSEATIDSIVEELEITEATDTHIHREEWRKNVQSIQKASAEAKGTKRKSDEAGMDTSLMSQLVTQVASLQTHFLASQGSSSSQRAAIMPPGAPAQPDMMMRELLAEPAAQPGSEVQSVLITMQASQLQLLLDTVRRSKEAVKSSMNACIQQVSVLKGDLTVLHNAEQLIQESMVQVTRDHRARDKQAR